tara:strand:- start:1662 stop:2216 length:555 start_codon:yes stop_codon:yes gene_type:complete
MAFWTDVSANLTEPKRAYRFIVNIANFPDGAQWYAKSATKPSFNINEAKHSYLNHSFYYPGRVEWNPVSITLVDPGQPDASANLLEFLSMAGYAPPSTQNDLSTLSKGEMVSALGQITIEQIDSNGNMLEQWTMNGSWITEISYSDLSYESDDLTELSLTIRYDWATCNTTNPSNEGNTEFFQI